MNKQPEQDVLGKLNELLESKDNKLTSSFSKPEFPICFIIALPRTGSTLFQQVLASTLDIGYVSNLMASFWSAPYIGALFEKKFQDKTFFSTFKSQYGNTKGVFEPHEWGWFWKKFLNLKGDDHYIVDESRVDINILKKKLAAIEYVKKSPLIFDNVYTVANLSFLKKSLSNTVVVYLNRDPYYVTNSIINARVKRYGTIDQFYGHPPHNISQIKKIEHPIEQIVMQVKTILDEIKNSFKLLSEKSVLEIQFDYLLKYPAQVSVQFCDFYQKQGINLNMDENKLEMLNSFENRNSNTLLNKDYNDDLNYFYKKYFG